MKLSFLEYLEESTIHFFDKDDAILKPAKGVRIHVNNSSGERAHSLTTSEFNHHKLSDGHSYDFSDFKDPSKIGDQPIHPVMSKLQDLTRKGKKVEILTARSDFTDKKEVANKMRNVGVEIEKGRNRVHLRRAGNLGLKPHEAKAQMISKAIGDKGYKTVHLYDDHLPNIDAMLALKEKHPNVNFHGHHVQHGEDGKVSITRYKA